MRKTHLNFSLSVSIIKEENRFIAYSPAIDLKSYKEAKQRFTEAVSVFFEELHEKGTMEEVLLDLGWKKKQKEWIPPVVVSHESEEINVYA